MPSQCLLLVRHFLVNDINVEELFFVCLFSLIAVNKYPTTWNRKDCSRSQFFVKVLFTIALKACWNWRLWECITWAACLGRPGSGKGECWYFLFFLFSIQLPGWAFFLNLLWTHRHNKTSHRHTQTWLLRDYDSVELTVKIKHCWLVQWFLVYFILFWVWNYEAS